MARSETATVTTAAIPQQKDHQTYELHDPSNYLGQAEEHQKQQQHSRYHGSETSLPTTTATGSNNTLVADEASPPDHAVSALPRWNSTRASVFKTMSTFFGFVVMGANDAVYGAIIPYLGLYYRIPYTVVSLVFLSPMVGYIAAAALNNLIHKHVGQRGVAMIGPGAHVLAYTAIVLHPPYPVLVLTFVLAGFGNGVLDAAWNAWLGSLANPNEILGVLHGFYGVGATVAPLLATAMVAQFGLPWYSFYYIMIGAAGIELASATAAFWKETSRKFRAAAAASHSGATRAALKQRVTWVAAIFLLIYVGIEVALGGWIVTFMIQVRDGQEFESGIVATGFWLGITLGRVVLGFVTPRLGENVSIVLYLVLAIGMQLLFWLVPVFVVSSIAVALVGFFLGPLFPAAVVATTKLLPAHLHIGAIGFAAAFGGSGACVLPFAVGAIAQQAGVSVLQPIILAILACAALLWAIGMPRIGNTPDPLGIKSKQTTMLKMLRECFTCLAHPKG